MCYFFFFLIFFTLASASAAIPSTTFPKLCILTTRQQRARLLLQRVTGEMPVYPPLDPLKDLTFWVLTGEG